MPSTTPDLSTVTAGGSSLPAAGGSRAGAAAPALASVNVDGPRPPRRGGESTARARSDLGQASSKLAGGTSPDSAAGGGAAGTGADGSPVRASARSRSFRDDEENNRLRRGLRAGAGSGAAAGGGPAGPPLPATAAGRAP